jgi:hypothetical protein
MNVFCAYDEVVPLVMNEVRVLLYVKFFEKGMITVQFKNAAKVRMNEFSAYLKKKQQQQKHTRNGKLNVNRYYNNVALVFTLFYILLDGKQ